MVALRLLEVMRDRDLPREILEDEDPTRTIPRRFGLSDVVERQIRTYKADARKGARLTDEEISGLFRFVIRRPDAEEVFREVGRLLATPDKRGRWSRLLPRTAQFSLARSRTRKKLRKLFGRVVGGFAPGPFVVEGRALLFIESDPGGDACHLLSGFCQEVIEQTLGGNVRVSHVRCQGRGDQLCRWEAEIVDEAARVAPAAAEAEV